MAETRIELRGWPAIVAGILILAVSAYRLSTRFPKIPDDGRETLRHWLVKDYEGLGPAALAKRVADYKAGVVDTSVQPPATEPRVEFTSLTAHGSPDVMVVRCELTVDGGPPEGRSVRYLFLTTRVGGGWMVFGESDSYRYYTMLFR